MLESSPMERHGCTGTTADLSGSKTQAWDELTLKTLRIFTYYEFSVNT